MGVKVSQLDFLEQNLADHETGHENRRSPAQRGLESAHDQT
jgi:hypothetical protein